MTQTNTMNSDVIDGRHSSLSVTGEHLRTSVSITPPKKTYKYKRIAGSSSVDETLFSSHRDQQLSRLGSAKGSARAATQRSPKDHPPRTNSGLHKTPPIKSSLGINSNERPQSRTRYRIKHTSSSYVDETLFGPPLESPTFDPPWADNKEEKKRGKPLFWSPPVVGSLSCTPLPTDYTRPGSTVGRPHSATGKSRPSTPSKPPWK